MRIWFFFSFKKSWCFIVDIDDDRRRMLRTKVKQGLAAAETLKRRIREINSNSRPVVSPASPSENCKFVLYFFVFINKLFSL